jgi:hypothetical protein
MRGLDPRIHLPKKIDRRVEPGNDERKDGSVKENCFGA